MLFGPLTEEAGGGALMVHPYWVVVSIVQFLILFYLLRRFLWGPIQATLQRRADRIREGLEAAEAAKREREQMTAEVERLLGEARQEAKGIAERSTKAAEDAAAQIRVEAKAEADRIRERARADAEQLHRQALAQLRGEVASMAVLAASRILGKEIDERAHRDLVALSLEEAGGELGEGRRH
jgi:F-type H+-transporting ATPase subunit b